MKEDKNLEFIIKYKYIIIILMTAGFIFLAAFLRNTIEKQTKELAIKIKKEAAKENNCERKLAAKNYLEAMKCYEKNGLLNKSFEIRYKYAISLLSAEKYDEAREELLFISRNEKNNKVLINKAKNKAAEIDKYFEAYEIAKSRDFGDYYKEIGDNLIWPNAKKISVYIDNKDMIVYEITKEAFENWSDGAGVYLNFNYTDDKAKADIECTYSNYPFNTIAKKQDVTLEKLTGSKTLLSKAIITIPVGDLDLSDKKTKETYLKNIMHRIGHALGVSYHSPSKNDIMHENPNDVYDPIISKRDLNTFKRTYDYL